MYLNKAIIVGNLTRDPELKVITDSDVKTCAFSVATNRVWKDKNGAKQESVDFHNIVVYGKQAETTAQYMKKGSQVLVEGRIQTRSWEKDGVKMYRTEIVAESIKFGSKPIEKKEEVKNDKPDVMDKVEYPNEEINAEDIPF